MMRTTCGPHESFVCNNEALLTDCSFLTSKSDPVKIRSRLMAFSYILRLLPLRRSRSISLRSTLRLKITFAYVLLDTPSTSIRQRLYQMPELSYFP